MRVIEYNEQRDNFDFKGIFKGSCQCFSTTVWMFLSFFCSLFKAKDDKMLATFVDDVCNLVGSPGIAEDIAKEYSLDVKDNLAYQWLIQEHAIQKWLWSKSVKGTTVLKVDLRTGRGLASWDEIRQALKISPVIIRTYKMGGLPGGHIILIVDIDGNDLICNDPYGDARTGYKNINGENVRYSIDWITPFTDNHVRAMWWDASKGIA